MERTPFIGRLPLAVGDDLTDEAMFRAANDARWPPCGSENVWTTDRRAGASKTPAMLRAWIAARGALKRTKNDAAIVAGPWE